VVKFAKEYFLIMSNSPIKRHKALRNLSREHHDGLIFALRLQKGVAKSADLQSMEEYVSWFWENHLQPHFKLEENCLFPMLKGEYELVREAIVQHQDLKMLFQIQQKTLADFKRIYELLQKHIRLEERELFNLIQSTLSAQQLAIYEKTHKRQQSCAMWQTQFWS
jgi:hemerythrin-like domain-containing protein